jgi:hypothetical protein
VNRYLFLRGLFGPALLVTFGVTALLDQGGLLPFDRSWPLYIIVVGLLRLAEYLTLTAWPPPSAPAPQAWAPAPVPAAAPWSPATTTLPAPSSDERR